MPNFPPIDLRSLRYYAIASRRSLASPPGAQEAPPPPGAMPARTLSGIERLAGWIREAASAGRPVVWGLGPHVLKTGLGALISDLVARGLVNALVANGAFAVHDLELAMTGSTSEDVAEALPKGEFGFAAETSREYLAAAAEARRSGRGLGECLGERIARSGWKGAGGSVLAACASGGVRASILVSIGCDIVHMHPGADGADLGASSLHDFRCFASAVHSLGAKQPGGPGGVYINCGSAVVLPEAFLKAVSIAINLGADLSGARKCVIDMMEHYRPSRNVLERPPGESLFIKARHEVVLPALHRRLTGGVR